MSTTSLLKIIEGRKAGFVTQGHGREVRRRLLAHLTSARLIRVQASLEEARSLYNDHGCEGDREKLWGL